MNAPSANTSAAVPEDAAAGTASGRLYSGQHSSERARERYGKFIEAGLEVFGTVGYQGAKIKTLCKSAGLSERYFYESFESREHLLTVVYEVISAQLSERVTESLGNPEAELQDAVRAGMAAVVNFMLVDPRHAQIILVEIVGVSTKLESLRHASMIRFAGQSLGALLRLSGIDPKEARILPGGGGPDAAPGTATPMDPDHPLATALDFARLTAISMVGGVNNMLLDAVLGGTTGNREQIIDVAFQLICNASSGIRALAAEGRANAAAPAAQPTATAAQPAAAAAQPTAAAPTSTAAS